MSHVLKVRKFDLVVILLITWLAHHRMHAAMLSGTDVLTMLDTTNQSSTEIRSIYTQASNTTTTIPINGFSINETQTDTLRKNRPMNSTLGYNSTSSTTKPSSVTNSTMETGPVIPGWTKVFDQVTATCTIIGVIANFIAFVTLTKAPKGFAPGE